MNTPQSRIRILAAALLVVAAVPTIRAAQTEVPGKHYARRSGRFAFSVGGDWRLGIFSMLPYGATTARARVHYQLLSWIAPSVSIGYCPSGRLDKGWRTTMCMGQIGLRIATDRRHPSAWIELGHTWCRLRTGGWLGSDVEMRTGLAMTFGFSFWRASPIGLDAGLRYVVTYAGERDRICPDGYYSECSKVGSLSMFYRPVSLEFMLRFQP